MRSILILIFLISSSLASAATYYVATNGSDSNPGTIGQPFATWQKGFTIALPGDIVYIRGGVYYPKGIWGDDVYSGVYINNKNGSAGKMINIWAYPGEKPILDCKNMTMPESHMGVFLNNCDYWYLKGLTIKNCIQTPGFGAHGFYLKSGNYNRIEQLDISFIGGSGLAILYNSEQNYIYNCDVHDCFDQYTKRADGTPNPGEHADGIDLADITERPGNERVNTLRGIRCWNNADDGFDHYRVDGVLIIDSCWVWHNGYNYGGNTPTGDGNGFKLGKTEGTPESYSQRTITNCIAYGNRQRGFSQENANVNMILYNNVAYKNNLQGFAFVAHDRPDILRNNISYRNSGAGDFQPKQIHDHNSWDSQVTLSDDDFVSLDPTQLAKPRKPNGSLPDITFLKLAPGSDMIDKGVSVGRTFLGKAPDMGPFEFTSTTSTSTNLSYVSSVVETATPSLISVTYSSTLANILPAATRFTVMINSAQRTVNSVSVSGLKILLTLSSPVASGDTVTLSYSKPTSNMLQGTNGSQAASITAQPVTNNVAAVEPQAAGPAYLNAFMENPNTVEVNYSLQLAPVTPDPSSFNILVDEVQVNVNGVSINGSSVFLSLEKAVSSGEEVILDYTVPETNPIQCNGAGKAANLIDIPVENELIASNPEYLSAVIEDNSPDKVLMTYSAELASSTPETSAFLPKINGISVSVKSVSISGNKVILTLQKSVDYNDIVTVAYVKPAENSLVAVSGGSVLTFPDKTVINNSGMKEGISIFPNPVSDIINIFNPEPVAGKLLIRIFDLSGKLCMETFLGNESSSRIPVNLKSGIYIIQILTGPVVKHAQKLVVR